jgi:hypoxanthine phosphoribosyltransferase
MSEKIDVLISEGAVKKRIQELADTISKDYGDKEVVLVCVLKGAIMFMVDISKELKMPVSFDFMVVSSYGNDTKSSGTIKIVKDLDDSIEGKHVLLIEDIIDSGRTLSHLMVELNSRKPASLKLCTLLDKPDRRVNAVDVDYTGFTIPDEFVVGYGLDYAQKYRNLPYIGRLTLE